MSAHRHLRLPISTRHAFALAFDLAFRRDALHSLLVPLLLRAPWILALMLLPAPADSDRPELVVWLTAVALIGDFLVLVLVSAMLRFRARSVFNTSAAVPPMPVGECYGQGMRRVPWLILTEVARNVALFVSTIFLVVPGIFLGFRLSLAAETVVLDSPHTASAFRRSFHLSEGRFERWLEMVVVSVGLAMAAILAAVILSLALHAVSFNVWIATARLLVTAMSPVITYAWTFFYLRLAEIDWPIGPGTEVEPAYAAAAAPSNGVHVALGTPSVPIPGH
jgi:hypothetical protein